VATADVAGSGPIMSCSLVALAWTRFRPRTVALATALGGEARFFGDGFSGSSIAARPFAYLAKSVQTWRMLSRAALGPEGTAPAGAPA
jgi:hypothetical protein